MKRFVLHMAAVPITIVSSFLATSDNHRIAYTHYEAGHDKVIVIAHGFYNSKDAVVLQNLAKGLVDEYDVFMFDFRGHGKSDGLYTWTSEEGRDLAAALEFVKDRYAKKGVIGFSLGGSVSINVLSKERLADSLICVSSASEAGKINYHFWELSWAGDLVYTLFGKEGGLGKGCRPGPFWMKKEKPVDNAGKLGIPVLYIHGDKDWVVKPKHSKVLYDKTSSVKKMEIIKGGAHAEYLFRDNPEKLTAMVKDWFRQTL